MRSLTHQISHGYHIGTDQPLSPRQLQQLQML